MAAATTATPLTGTSICAFLDVVPGMLKMVIDHVEDFKKILPLVQNPNYKVVLEMIGGIDFLVSPVVTQVMR